MAVRVKEHDRIRQIKLSEIEHRLRTFTLARCGRDIIVITTDRLGIVHHLPTFGKLEVIEERKRPLYKVDMDLRTGRGYNPKQLTSTFKNYELLSDAEAYDLFNNGYNGYLKVYDFIG